MNNPEYIVIHSTDVSWTKNGDQLQAVNTYHKGQDFPLSKLGYYVGYHQFISGGKNTQCRLPLEVGAHTNQIVDGKSMNLQSLAVCVACDGDIEYPHPDDYALLKRQVQDWQFAFGIPDSKVKFHRDFNTSKSCPGALLGKEWLETLLDFPPIKPDDQKAKAEEIQTKITLYGIILDLLRKINAIIGRGQKP